MIPVSMPMPIDRTPTPNPDNPHRNPLPYGHTLPYTPTHSP